MNGFFDNDSFLIIGHINADGDAVGSSCALARALRDAGKRAVVAFPGAVPDRLRYLTDGVMLAAIGDAALAEGFDCAVAVDCAAEERMGELAQAFHACAHTMVIDHHPTNPGFGGINLLSPTAAAAQIVLKLLADEGFAVTSEIADNLYAALISDCGNFCHDNTDADAFEAAAVLTRAGADVTAAARRLFGVRSLETAKVNAWVIEHARFFAGGRIAAGYIEEEALAALGAEKQHCDEAVQELKSIEGVEIAVFARAAGADGAKASLRAVKGHDVASAAERFGGGGHLLAAGCFIAGKTAEQVMEEVTAAVMETL